MGVGLVSIIKSVLYICIYADSAILINESKKNITCSTELIRCWPG